MQIIFIYRCNRVYGIAPATLSRSSEDGLLYWYIDGWYWGYSIEEVVDSFPSFFQWDAPALKLHDQALGDTPYKDTDLDNCRPLADFI